MSTDHAALARRFLTDVWGQGDAKAIDELADPDIHVWDTNGTDATGIARLRAYAAEIQRTFTGVSFTIHEIIVAGDRAIARYTWRGTQIGDFLGIPPTGRPTSSEAVEVLRFANGKVVETLAYIDTYPLFQQLGAIPPREQLARPPA